MEETEDATLAHTDGECTFVFDLEIACARWEDAFIGVDSFVYSLHETVSTSK